MVVYWIIVDYWRRITQEIELKAEDIGTKQLWQWSKIHQLCIDGVIMAGIAL